MLRLVAAVLELRDRLLLSDCLRHGCCLRLCRLLARSLHRLAHAALNLPLLLGRSVGRFRLRDDDLGRARHHAAQPRADHLRGIRRASLGLGRPLCRSLPLRRAAPRLLRRRVLLLHSRLELLDLLRELLHL